MSDNTCRVDMDEIASPVSVKCNSELKSLKVDVYDGSKKELGISSCLIEDNLKKECFDAEIIEITVNKIPLELKTSPHSKSRYGRTHKPKIDEDFLSTDKKVGAILGIGILCTPQKSNVSSSRNSTPRKLWHSPNESYTSDVASTDLDTSTENISRTYRKMCSIIFSPQTENFKGFSKEEDGSIVSSWKEAPECEWQPGDLAWARVGSHPYWPCIVTSDTNLHTFKKIALRGLRCTLLIHVQFYGDKGRHSWLSASALKKYEGLDVFTKLCDEITKKLKSKYRKRRDPYIVRQSSKAKWDVAVSESEAVFPQTREMRLQDFMLKYPNLTCDESVLSPELDRSLPVKRKGYFTSMSQLPKKVKLAQEDIESCPALIKKEFGLSEEKMWPGMKKKLPVSLENGKMSLSPPKMQKVQSPCKMPTVPLSPPKMQTDPSSPPKMPTDPSSPPKMPTDPSSPPKMPTDPSSPPKMPTDPSSPPKMPTDPSSPPKMPTDPSSPPKMPTDPSSPPKMPTDPSSPPKMPTDPSSPPKVPTDPSSPPKMPTDPSSPPKMPTDPSSPPKMPTDPSSPPKMPTDPSSPPKMPTDPSSPPKMPTDPSSPPKMPTDPSSPPKMPTDPSSPPDMPTDPSSPAKMPEVSKVPPWSPEKLAVPAVSPPEKKKVQAKIEQFFAFTRASPRSEMKHVSVANSKQLVKEKLSEDSLACGIEVLQEDKLLQTVKTPVKDEDVAKLETDNVSLKQEADDLALNVSEVPKIIATPKSRKSLRLSLSLPEKVAVKPDVDAADKVSPDGSRSPDGVAVPQAGDDPEDEWLPRKQQEKRRGRAAAGEQGTLASLQRVESKQVPEEEEAFYQFSLVHTQIVMDDNPLWSEEKVDSYVRMLWSNLDDEDKAKYDKRTDADKKKQEPRKVEKPSKRLYSRKKKEVDASDDETASSLSSEEQEVSSKEGIIASALVFRERKPASLFRGMKTEKVCQVCEVAGNTVRCKGPCLGVYHLACLAEPRDATATPAEGAVSSDSGVEESDSDAGDGRARSEDGGVPLHESSGTVAEEMPRKWAPKAIARESPAANADTDKLKKTSMKKKLKGDKDDDLEEDKTKPSYLCPRCVQGRMAPCFACGKDTSESGELNKQRCVVAQCGKFYHLDCLKMWPQAWFSTSSSSRVRRQDCANLSCPQHTCHTCASDDPRNFNTRFANERLVRCVRCPTAYHFGNHCVPAGSIVLNMTQIICSRHCNPQRKGSHHVNAAWCFICAMGGSLICCDLCPTSFHAECLNISPPEGGYICEDCGTGRFPLYGEIVWAKLGNYRWWPAQIVFPDQVPENIDNLPHSDGEFVVRFFGSHDYNWVNRSRVFLYQEGDSAYKKSGKTSVDTIFLRAVDEAQEAHNELNIAKASREAEPRQAMKPPQYVKIKFNKPVGNVRVVECDPASLVPCYCDPKKPNPCGPDSDCLNRILLVECNPSVCRAGDKCRNQRFEKREYPPLIPYRTDGRGWGLRTLADIKKGDFVIEYVGEMIDEAEYKRRLERKHLEKDENYYFLTIDKDRMLDAGPKGNVSRFMNHSCNPNCETQKWTVNGDTRVGLFALEDIPANTEVTFNYNLQCASTDKKKCMCGALNCSGFIGSKASKVVVDEERKQRGKKKQHVSAGKPGAECFKCGHTGELINCDNKTCSKKYHLKCVNLARPSKGRWTCPWHQCAVCHKHRTSKRCSLCPNAYCSQHEDGNIDATSKGALCREHPQLPVISELSAEQTCELQTTDSADDGGKHQVVITELVYKDTTRRSGRNDHHFCEFQESRRKDLIEMRKAQFKRIGQKVTELCDAENIDSSLKNMVTSLGPTT